MSWFKPKGPRFTVSTDLHGDKSLSPKEFGYSCYLWATQCAKGEIENLFIGKTPEFELVRQIPLSHKIAAAPRFAHLVFAMRNAAIYYLYTHHFVTSRKEILEDVALGTQDGIGSMRDENGEVLAGNAQRLLKELIGKFVEAIDEDIAQMNSREAGVIGVVESPSTKVLLQNLSEIYEDDSYPSALSGVQVANMTFLITMLNQSVITTFSTMTEGQLRITLNDPLA